MKSPGLRFVTASLTALAVALGSWPAQASSDYGITKVYSLVQVDSGNTVPFLSPSNDSRVSVLLLLSDAGLTRPHLLVPSEGDGPPNPYVGQTPLEFDTFADIMNDRQQTSDAPRFVEGEGDRCRSNAAARDSYLTALRASKVPAAEQTVLSAARQALAGACNADASTTAAVTPGAIRSTPGKEFASYLTGAAAFYAGDFNAARFAFTGLSGSRQPWLKEAARYMTARTDLNIAQIPTVGQYGEMTAANADMAALAKADSEFRAYLNDYPRGAYVNSARGLLRRVAWLSGDSVRLGAALGDAFAAVDPNSRNVSALQLAYEIDNKLLTQVKPQDIHEPRLLAARDLMAMRRYSDAPSGFTRAELEAQRPLFANHKPLYDYLLAAYAFYDEDDPAGALKIVGADSPEAAAGRPLSSVAFSRLVLKGLALEAQKRQVAARAHWLALIPLAEPVLQRPAVEIALAQNFEHSGDLAAVFAPGSAVRTPTYREILLAYSAGPDLLRQRATATSAAAHERGLALNVLLFKELTRGRYSAFLDDLRLLPTPRGTPNPWDQLGTGTDVALPGDFDWAGTTAADGFACPSIKAIAEALSRDPRAGRSLICLGEYLRVNNYDGVLRGIVSTPSPDATPMPPMPPELGAAPSQFPGRGISRLEIYQALINNRKAEADVRAYALYRAVNCWAPSANNSCDEQDLPKSERKKWFDELKSRYPDTAWAQKLKYYW